MTKKENRWTSDFDFFTCHKNLKPYEYFKLDHKHGDYFIQLIQVKNYKELAVAIYRNKNKDHTDKSDITDFYECIKEIFERSIEFIKWSRNIFDWPMYGKIEYPEIEYPLQWKVRFPWIMAGEEFIWFFEEMAAKYEWPQFEKEEEIKSQTDYFNMKLSWPKISGVIMEYPYKKLNWPKSPSVTVFDEVEQSALGVIVNFASKIMVCYILSGVRNHFLVDPKSWEGVRLSKLDISKNLHKYVSASKWSDSDIKREKERLMFILKSEYEQTLAAQNLQEPEKTERGENETKHTISKVEYSLPLPMKKWAEILRFSENKMKEIREEGKTYHFKKVSPRKWQLPKGELPAEYLEKYRSITKQKPQ